MHPVHHPKISWLATHLRQNLILQMNWQQEPMRRTRGICASESVYHYQRLHIVEIAWSSGVVC